jgi:hypothetical protein
MAWLQQPKCVGSIFLREFLDVELGIPRISQPQIIGLTGHSLSKFKQYGLSAGPQSINQETSPGMDEV